MIARVEQTEVGTPLVDVERIRNTLAANGVGIIGGTGTTNVSITYNDETTTKLPINGIIHKGGDTQTHVNKTITNVHEEVVSSLIHICFNLTPLISLVPIFFLI